MSAYRVGFFLVLLVNTTNALADTLTLAVASNFAAPMKALKQAFEQNNPHRLRVIHGASGKFYAQIHAGAPFDLFFSADQAKPQALEADKLIVPNSRRTYAVGRLALCSNRPLSSNTIAQQLKQGEFKALAFANPKLAPYGQAALEVLTALRLTHTSSKWVYGENIAQTYHFVWSGNASLGFLAQSQLSPQGINASQCWMPPPTLYKSIIQDAVIIKDSPHLNAANAFMAFIQSAKAVTIIESFGYAKPKAIGEMR